MIELIIFLIVLAIVVVIACIVIDLLPLPAQILMLCKLLVGVIALILLLQRVLPALGHMHI